MARQGIGLTVGLWLAVVIDRAHAFCVAARPSLDMSLLHAATRSCGSRKKATRFQDRPAMLRPSMRFRSPSNGYEEEVGPAWLWCLLFGFIYFAVKGVWSHAVVSFVLAFITVGVSWLIYPFFARKIVETDYLRRGWVPV
jgi:hypothetical protein